MSWKEFGVKTWDRVSLAVLKCFRGLVCEKKDGGWELSKGRTAFWVVLTHCMYVWNGGAKAAKAVVDTAIDATTAAPVGAGEAIADAAAAVATSAATAAASASALSAIADSAGSLSMHTGVPEQEFYLLMALLGYAALKTTKGSLTNALIAMRGNK